MAEFMTGMKRTDYCGDLRIGDVGREVTVCGWVQRCRDLGQLIFIDLRDRTGIVQLAFNDKTDKEIFDKAFSCRSEFVLAAKGVVCERSSKNSEIPTGDIEVVVSDMRVLSKAQTPPSPRRPVRFPLPVPPGSPKPPSPASESWPAGPPAHHLQS